MKKLLTLGFAILTAMVASANMADLRITFRTTGPDAYKDGTPAMNGEFYALVWLKAGSAFGGFNADATLIDAVNNRLLACVPFAEGAPKTHCAFALHQVAETEAVGLAGGTFIVVLLDTRNADGSALSGVRTLADGTKLPVAVNGYSTVVEVPVLEAAYSKALRLNLPVEVSSVSAVPDGAPRPVITDIKLRDGAKGREAVLKVKGTVPYLHYIAAGGDEVGTAGKTRVEESATSGANDVEQEIELVVPADKAAKFYRVGRK